MRTKRDLGDGRTREVLAKPCGLGTTKDSASRIEAVRLNASELSRVLAQAGNRR